MSRHKHATDGEREMQACRAQIQHALEVLAHYHFAHSYLSPDATERSGLTAFRSHESDVLIVSDPKTRAKIEALLKGKWLDYPDVPKHHGAQVEEAHLEPLR